MRHFSQERKGAVGNLVRLKLSGYNRAMTLDRLHFSRLAQYLDALPQRTESYPSALTKADFSIILRGRMAAVLARPDLPANLRAVMTVPWQQDAWIPTTTYVALCALARDQLWQSEEAFHRGMLEVAHEMYKGPVLRTLFVMFGPSLVAMSATKRWYTLHQGTELVMKKQTKESAHMVLTFPPKLFCESGVRSLGAAFCAIAEGSRGKDPSFALLALSDTEAEVMISWKY